MEVLIKEELFPENVQDSLTTKFVHDWRAGDYTLPDGSVTKRWLRRSRLVAREYAFMERRDACFSPATSTHVMNLFCQWFTCNDVLKDVAVKARQQNMFWRQWTSKMLFYVCHSPNLLQ